MRIYSFSDEMLKAAVVRVDRHMLDALPGPREIEHNFSLNFERKMKQLIRSQNNQRRKRIRKRYAAVLAAVIVLLASLMSVSAIRESVFDFIVEKYEKFTHIFFVEAQASSLPDATEPAFIAYAPTYIPEGFQLELQDIGDSVFLAYTKGDEWLNFSQQKLNEVSMDLNTEGVTLEVLDFNGLPAKYFSNKGIQNLIWRDDTYMYMVSSSLQKEAIMQIAESMKPITK